jgi:hypothetical protein
MKTMTRLFAALFALAITVGSVTAAPRPEPKSKAFQIRGRVLQIDQKALTLVVAEDKSEKLYLVIVPEGAYFKVTFGRAMKLTYPEFSDLNRKDRVQMKVRASSGEQLTLLQDGRKAVVLVASR